MSRTPGSGWGAGPLLYQVCAHCGRKKALYDPIPGAEYFDPFRCTYCKKRFDSDLLKRTIYPSP